MRMHRLFLLAVLGMLLGGTAFAADPAEMLKDPLLERRAEEIGQGLRCVVCQGESIEASNADLARDLRVIVRERITKGETNEQVVQFVVDRYGDFVLLKPPFKITTLALWLGPFALLLLGLGAAVQFYRRRETSATPPLSAEETHRLEALLKERTP